MSRYIDADKVLKIVNDMTECEDDYERITEWIHNMPSIDIVPCEECKWRNAKMMPKSVKCLFSGKDDDFCSYGERGDAE